MRVLIIEDGLEYFETLSRYLPAGFSCVRAGSGPQALALLAEEAVDVIYLDMRFDRAPPAELLGDLDAATDRHNGDRVAGRQFLEDHQGTYILAALRDAGVTTPALLSYDLEGEPRRLARLQASYGPLLDLPDGAGPTEVARRLRMLVEGAF